MLETMCSSAGCGQRAADRWTVRLLMADDRGEQREEHARFALCEQHMQRQREIARAITERAAS